MSTMLANISKKSTRGGSTQHEKIAPRVSCFTSEFSGIPHSKVFERRIHSARLPTQTVRRFRNVDAIMFANLHQALRNLNGVI
jgi:hypothetical protein